MKTFQIHLIRHGLTEANLNGQYAGATDFELLDEGKRRLAELKRDFSYPAADEIVSSPLKRCRQTAEILYPEQVAKIENAFAECDFGDWEGKSAAELKNDENFVKWLNNSGAAAPNGGENLKDFAARIMVAFEKLVENAIKNNVKDTVLVTHGGVIMTILAAYGIPRAKFYDWVVNNGCGYSLRIMPSLWMRQKVGEVYSKIPSNLTRENNEESMYILDLVREASNRAYGESSEKS